MKVSIITVTYNSAETLEATIESVLQQEYSNIEYIIIDGNSNDSTLSVIGKYQGRIAKVVSEKDEGLYFAINKGIELATGDVIGILHSDDLYANSQTISEVVDAFTNLACDSLYGDLVYVDRDNTSNIKRSWVSGEYTNGIFLKGWMPPHPTFFVRKEVYDRLGLYNTILRSSADYELMLRYLHKNKISVGYLPKVLVKMRVGGQSNVSIKNRIKANKEDRLAWKLNDIDPGLLTTLRKPFSKIKQFLKRN